MDISGEDVESMSSEQKQEMLCSDPITTARHFLQRFQKFRAFMKSSSKPIGRLLLASGIPVVRKPPCTFTVVGERCS